VPAGLPVSDLLLRVNEVFRDVLDEPGLNLQPDSTPDTVEGWDSLSHMQIVAELESRFEVRFTTAEIQSFSTVARVLEVLFARMS
jgi:acyl carrier protein